MKLSDMTVLLPDDLHKIYTLIVQMERCMYKLENGPLLKQKEPLTELNNCVTALRTVMKGVE